MSAIRPKNYADSTAYAKGTKVTFNGVIFLATEDIPDTNTTNPLSGDGGIFRAIGVIEGGYDAISLWYDVFFTANEESLEDHIWTFIEAASIEINQILEGPSIRVTRSVLVDDQSRVDVSQLNFTDLENVRINSSDDVNLSTGNSIYQRGRIEMLAGNRAEFEQVKQQYGGSETYYQMSNYENPLYYLEDGYLHLAPDMEEGTEIQITFQEYQPILGSEQFRVNADYEPLNNAGQTMAQWIANGNSVNTFEQEVVNVETNIWFAQFPKLYKFAVLKHAEAFLGSTEKVESWKKAYLENLQITQDYLDRFDSNQPHQITMFSTYATL